MQDEEGNHHLPSSDVDAVKREIVGLMITVPYPLQVQLGEAISIIADSDFYVRWNTLIDVRDPQTASSSSRMLTGHLIRTSFHA